MKTYRESSPSAPMMDAAETVDSSRSKKQQVGAMSGGITAQEAALAATPDGEQTYGGSWTTSAYNEVVQPGARGAYIFLHFTPNTHVDATQIGLTQTVKAIKTTDAGSEAMYGGDPQRKNRALDGVDEGTNLDKAAGQSSPYFAGNGREWSQALGKAVAAAHGNDDLPRAAMAAKTRAEKGKPPSTFGMRSGGKVVDATLRDRARQTWSKGVEIDAEFETTAVAKSSDTQQGVFYGSITWGYKVDKEGKVKLKPVTTAHMGVPSERFSKAAKKWNEADGYTVNKWYEAEAVRAGVNPTLQQEKKLSKGHQDFLAKREKTADWQQIGVKLEGNQKLPIATMTSPGNTANKEARIKELEAMLEATGKDAPDETTRANIAFELSVLRGGGK